MSISKFELHPAVQGLPTLESGGDEWIQWHKTLKSAMGKKQANIVWLKAWSMRAGKGSSASTKSLRDYIAEQGIDIDKTTIESIGDEFSEGVDFIGDIFKTGTWFAVSLGAIIVVGVGIAIINIAKQSGGIAKDAAKAYTTKGLK